MNKTMLSDEEKKAIEELKDKNKTLSDCAEPIERTEKIRKYEELQDKIKAKIEEVKDGTYDAKIVLQSLLEKE